MLQLIFLMQFGGASYEVTASCFEGLSPSVDGIRCLMIRGNFLEFSSLIDRDVFPDIYKAGLHKAKDHIFCNLLTKPIQYGVAI